MTTRNYVDYTTPVVDAAWLNDADAVIYEALGTGGVAPTTAAEVRTNLTINSYTGTFTNKSIDLTNNTLTATSAQLRTAVTDETGTGALVFANTPTLVTPVIGAATGVSLVLSSTVSATQYTSTIATGTAPLVVASTTEVANLKAATATTATTATTVSTTVASGAVGTTQSANDNSTKIATTAYADKGKVAQIVNSTTGAVATGTTIMPDDDTIPQNTEGTEFLSLAITPKNASSTLLISVTMNISSSAATGVVAALFVDATASALAATLYEDANTGQAKSISIDYYVSAASTSARTYKVRSGPGGAATVTVNGVSGSRLLGGVYNSSITITEILP